MEGLNRYRRVFFALAIVAGVLGAVSDLFLLYTPGIRYEPMDYVVLHTLAPCNLIIGQTLGMIVIPLHIFGFLVIFPLLDGVSMAKQLLLGFLAVVLLAYGVHYHGLILPTRTILMHSVDPTWVAYSVKPLESAVTLIFVTISLLLGWEIFKGRTKYKRSALLLLPITPYLVLFALYLLRMPASNALMAMGLNLSFLVFFSASFVIGNAPSSGLNH